MIAEVELDFNELSFVASDEFMKIDIQPEYALEPVRQTPADKQPALTYLAGLGRSSQRTQWSALCVVAAVLTAGQCSPVTLPWWTLRRQHVNAVRAWLIEHRKPATGKRCMAALRGTLKECWRLDLMSIEEYHRAIDIKPIKGEGPAQAAGRALTAGEFDALLIVCDRDKTVAGVRDAAILGLAIRCGLRRAEIASLELADYNQVEQKLTVRGKGNKTRVVHVTPGAAAALADWLTVRGNVPGRLLLAVNKGGRIEGTGITDAAIYDAMAKRAKEAGVRKFSPHDGRRTFAGDLLDAGADISTVQQLMGHADPRTTAGYDRRPEHTKRAAVNRLHMRWERRY